MKKFITFIFAAFFAAVGLNAQIATENSKFTDNLSIGAGVVATTPLDFNGIFPVNAGAGIKFGKEVTPVLGFEIEAGALFNDNHFGRYTSTFVKLTNVSVNGKLNMSNLIAGYPGDRRAFEVGLNAGLGWLHGWNTSYNAPTAKTGVDFMFNFGKEKSTALIITPAVYWNLKKQSDIQFNRNATQLGVSATFVYRFKNSNGGRSFRTYDVGALLNENAFLRDELAKKPRVEKVTEYVEKKVPVTTGKVYVLFAKNSAELNDAAKEALKGMKAEAVSVKAYASPEGADEYNKKLSERRAEAVKQFLEAQGVKVTAAEGLGVDGKASNRIAVVITE